MFFSCVFSYFFAKFRIVYLLTLYNQFSLIYFDDYTQAFSLYFSLMIGIQSD